REANWYLRSETYGTIAVGRQPDASVGLDVINLANPDGFANNGYAMGRSHQGYFLRRSGTTGNIGLSALNWNSAFHRNNNSTAEYNYSTDFSGVKYTSPFVLGRTRSSGFQVLTSWGMDDAFAAGLRYGEDFGAFRFAAGVAYSNWTNPDMLQCANASLS